MPFRWYKRWYHRTAGSAFRKVTQRSVRGYKDITQIVCRWRTVWWCDCSRKKQLLQVAPASSPRKWPAMSYSFVKRSLKFTVISVVLDLWFKLLMEGAVSCLVVLLPHWVNRYKFVVISFLSCHLCLVFFCAAALNTVYIVQSPCLR